MVSVQIPVAKLSVWLPGDMPRKVAEDSPSAQALVPMLEIPMKLQVLASAWSIPGCCGYLENNLPSPTVILPLK